MIKEKGKSELKKLRNAKIQERYNQLWKQDLRRSKIMEILSKEFFIDKSRIYDIISVKAIQRDETDLAPDNC